MNEPIIIIYLKTWFLHSVQNVIQNRLMAFGLFGNTCIAAT